MSDSADRTSRPCRLVLESGAVVRGDAFGARGVTSGGELVFNTAMCGYQESLTDPSYRSQILVETFPLMGCYGVNREDTESGRVQVAGFVVRELVSAYSNHRAIASLDAYLAEQGVLGISGVDTRAITRRIRAAGAMRAVLSDDVSLTDEQLLERARSLPKMSGADLASETSGQATAPTPSASGIGAGMRVLAIDCGTKLSIPSQLARRGVQVDIHSLADGEPATKVNGGGYDGVLVSNGPGDPAAVERVIESLRGLLAIEPAIPVLGICLGHQLLALALGAKTYKMPFGHRGANQPVRSRVTGKVEITSQNHGFAVDADSLRAVGGEPTHIHLNDGTLAGFRLIDRPLLAVQHHPEASPGPHDAASVFDAFIEMMRTRAPVKVTA